MLCCLDVGSVRVEPGVQRLSVKQQVVIKLETECKEEKALAHSVNVLAPSVDGFSASLLVF